MTLEAHTLVRAGRGPYTGTDKVQVVRQVRRMTVRAACWNAARVGILLMLLALVKTYLRLVMTVGAKRRSVTLPQNGACLARRIVRLVTGGAKDLVTLKVKPDGRPVTKRSPRAKRITVRNRYRVVRLHRHTTGMVDRRPATVTVTVNTDGIAHIAVTEIRLADVHIYIRRCRVAALRGLKRYRGCTVIIGILGRVHKILRLAPGVRNLLTR